MLKKNVFFNLLLSVSQILFPLITFPYASRILGPDGIGSVAFVDSITQVFLLFSALGIPIYGVREISKQKNTPENLSKLFSELVTIHFFCTMLFVIFYFVSALFIPKLHAHLPLVLVGICILIFNIFSLEWFFQGIESFSYITKRTLVVRCIFIFLLFSFVNKKGDLLAYYLLTAGTYLFNAIINFNFASRHVKFSFRNLNIRSHLKPLIIIFCSNVVISIYLILDNSILGFLKGEIAVGYYSTAVKFAKISLTVVTALGVVLIPQISSAFMNKDYVKINALVNKAFNYVCTIGFPLSVGLIIMAKAIVITIVGVNFSPAILVLQIIAPITIIIGLTNIFAWQILTPFGHDRRILIIVLCGMAVSLILNFLLIPHYSYLGTAFANVATELIVMLLSSYYVYKMKIINLSFSPLLNAVMGSLVFVLIAYVVRVTMHDSILREGLIVVICVCFYSVYQIFVIRNEIAVSILNLGTKKYRNIVARN